MKRNLLDITLEEVIEVLKLGDSWFSNIEYKIKKIKRDHANIDGVYEEWIRVYFERDGEPHIIMNISHNKNVINLCKGNTFYRNIYRIVKYLEDRNF